MQSTGKDFANLHKVLELVFPFYSGAAYFYLDMIHQYWDCQ